MTVSTEKSGSAIRRCSVGSANSGVPQKTMRRGGFVSGLPISGLRQLANLAFDEVAFQDAEVL
jgi:hypothetical protein